MNSFPFSDTRNESFRQRIDHNTITFFIRTFSKDVNTEELTWHRDKKNRIITPVKGNEWRFQYDNELPFYLKKGNFYFIEKETWHRLLLKDDEDSDLVLLIGELN